PLGLGHLLPKSTNHGSHLLRDSARDNHQIRLTRRRTKYLGAETRNVKTRCPHCHHLDGATCQTKRHGPNGLLTEPVHSLVKRRHDDALGRLLAEGHLTYSFQVVLTANQIQKAPCTTGLFCGFEHMSILAFYRFDAKVTAVEAPRRRREKHKKA